MGGYSVKKMNGTPLSYLPEGDTSFRTFPRATDANRAFDNFLKSRGLYTPSELAWKARADRARANRWGKSVE